MEGFTQWFLDWAPDWMVNIYIAVAAGVDYGTQTLILFFYNWMTWLIDPVTWFTAAQDFFTFLLNLIASGIGGDIGDNIAAFAQILQSDLFIDIWELMLWFFDPILNTDLLQLSITALMFCWCFAWMFKGASWIWSKVWSGSS